MVEKVKQSNIEFLRIIAMLMIIAHHFCVHGVFPVWKTNSNFLEYINSVIVSISSMGGKIGVDIFILITGYFMITSNWKFKHIVQIYLKMFIYSILFLLILCIFDSDSVTSTILNTSLFPFGGNAYWFITTYLMLYFFIPYLNKIILNSNNKQLNFLMGVTTLLWVIIPTFSKADYAFSDLLWFIYLYFVGASLKIKKYGEIFNNQKLISISALISIIYLIFYAVIKCLKPEIDLWKMCKPSALNTFFTLSLAIFMFKTFNNWDMKHNKIVNFVSSSVLGVYLFHDNNIVRPFLWNKLLNVAGYMPSPYLFAIMLCSIVGIFIFGIILDKIISLISAKPVKFICDKTKNIIWLNINSP